MNCPLCGKGQLGVADSRPVGGLFIRRRRECLACEYRFNTIEMPSSDWALVSLIGFLRGDKTKRHQRSFSLLAGQTRRKTPSRARVYAKKSLDKG